MLRHSFETFLQHEKRVSAHTLRAYMDDLDAFHAWALAQCGADIFSPAAVGNIGHRQLRSWMGSLAAQGLKNRSIARKLSSVRAYFRHLHSTGRLISNPATRLRQFKQSGRKLPAYLREAEAAALFDPGAFPDTFEGARDRAILELLYGCGLRRAELLALRLADLNLATRLLRVTGKGAKERLVPFGAHAAEALQRYQQAADNAGFSLTGSLFLSAAGAPAYPMLIYRLVQANIARVSAIQKRSPHVLRHSYATHMLDQGADLNAIKELLGHSSLAATQAYTHTSISKLKTAHQLAHPRAQKKEAQL